MFDKMYDFQSSHPHSDSGFYVVRIVYQCLDGNGETFDPDNAVLDLFGNPVIIRYEPSSELMDCCNNNPNFGSLNPNDSVSRTSALSALSDYNNSASRPQIYIDKFAAYKQADNIVNAFTGAVFSASALASSHPSTVPQINDL